MDACTLASKYADELMKAKTIEELGAVSSRIRASLHELVGFEGWLRDIWTSCHWALTTPEIPIEDMLNKEGLKALREGRLCVSSD